MNPTRDIHESQPSRRNITRFLKNGYFQVQQSQLRLTRPVLGSNPDLNKIHYAKSVLHLIHKSVNVKNKQKETVHANSCGLNKNKAMQMKTTDENHTFNRKTQKYNASAIEDKHFINDAFYKKLEKYNR